MNAMASRRQLFGASAALAVLGASGASASTTSDSDLLATCAEYHRAHANFMGTWVSNDQADILGDIRSEVLSRVIAMRPSSHEGLRAKASVALSTMMLDLDDTIGVDWRDRADAHEILAVDVLADLAGVGRV